MTGLAPVSFRKGRERKPRLSAPYVPGKRDPRFWTEAEDAVLRQYFVESGAAACQAHLGPHRSSSSIYMRAHALGLKSKAFGGKRQRHDYGPEMDQRIRDAWPTLKGKGAVNRLADELGVPRWWLSKRARALHLTMPHKKEPAWTAAEDALMRKVPLHDPDRAADIFREHSFARSPTAIVVRAKRLSLSRRSTHETLSATQVASILGTDSKTVASWCIAGDLPATRRGTRRLPQQGGDVWAIKPADLRRFIIERLERIDIRKVDKFAFVDVLVNTASTGAVEEVA